jgi:hypothetical protein
MLKRSLMFLWTLSRAMIAMDERLSPSRGVSAIVCKTGSKIGIQSQKLCFYLWVETWHCDLINCYMHFSPLLNIASVLWFVVVIGHHCCRRKNFLWMVQPRDIVE